MCILVPSFPGCFLGVGTVTDFASEYSPPPPGRFREYWMIIQYPCFLRRHINWLLPHPLPSIPSTNKLSLFLVFHVCRRSILLTGEGGGESSRTTARKLGPLEVIHWILSERRLLNTGPGGWKKAQIYSENSYIFGFCNQYCTMYIVFNRM